jgi:glycosyltransferase involved in cell wall biosynthesis
VKVALFTHHFLEPTHHAIAQVMGALPECEYTVYAKRFEDHFDVSNVVSRVPYTKGLADGLSRSSFDLVHAIYDGKTAMRAHGAAREAGLPFVLSFHGGFDTHAKIHDERYREATRRIAESATQVTVPSASDVALLARIGVRRATTILSVPVVIGVSAGHSLPHAHRLLLVGRLIPKKGVDVALSAMLLLPEYSLDVVGDGELRDELVQQAARLGVVDRVRFRGLMPLREVEALLAGAFALVHPARVGPDGNAEGTPQVVLLAQAMGVPVIAGASGNLSDVIDDGRSGLLVRPDDPAALACAVTRLAKDPALLAHLRHPAGCGERSIGRVAAQLRQIYRHAIREGGGA